HDEEFDQVARLEVVERRQADAAFESGTDFTHIFVEALERAYARVFHNHLAAALDAGAGVTACFTIADIAAGNGTDLADAEDLTDFGSADRLRCIDRIQHALNRQFD